MKSSNLLSSLWGAFALLAASAAAQIISPAPPANKDDPITLSAFTVTASSDVGYTATNTLAGTRLNTPLRDVGTAVSVVTKELLNDIGAHDSATLLSYTVGTEIGSVDGNFAGGAMQGPRADQNDARAEPERNQRVRGLASAELTRDYFLSDVPFDSYNTERVTINRGPNALLFGIGSPGGVINNSTIAPVFGNDFYETQLQLGARGTHRESFDFNRQLIPRRLAVRVAALNESTEFRQRPAWEKDQRVFGAVTAVLAENRRSPILGATTLRANTEYGDIEANPPNVIPPNDGFSSWWRLPDRSLQQFTGTTFPAYFDDGTYVPRNTIDNRTILPQTLPTLPMPFTLQYFLHLGLLYSRPGQPNFGFPNPQFSGLAGGQGRILYNPARDGRSRLDVFSTRSVFASPDFPGFTIPSIQDRNVFDYYNRLYTGDTNRSGRDFKTGTLTLEQGFWNDRAGLELSYDYQRYRTARSFPWGAGQDTEAGNAEVLIDIARYASNDQPNPNFGRPFYRTIGLVDSDSRTDRETARATAFVTLDGKDFFGKGRAGFWFGRHILTGMYFKHTINTRSRTFGMGWDSDTVNLTSLLNNTINQYRRQVTPVVYVGPSLLNTASPDAIRLQSIDAVLPRSGDRYPMFYFDPASRQIRNAEFTARRYLNSAGIGRREIESSVASLQSYFLDGHLITIAGARKDEQTVFERINLDNDNDPTTSDRLPTGDFDPAAVRLRSAPSDVSDGDTLTWSVVGRYPEKIFGRLPLGADLRLFFNQSENFNPVGARRNVFNERLAPPTGTTREYGAMVDLFGGKLSARINHFDTRGENFTNAALQAATGSSLSDIGEWLTRMLEAQKSNFTLEQAGLAQVGYTSYAQAYQEIINLLPEPTRSVRNFRIEPINGILTVQSNPILGAASTASFVAEGWELDLTANPLDGLRVMFNVSRQETVKANIAPDLKKLAAQTLANIDASRLRDVPNSPVISETTTYHERYLSDVVTPLTGELAKEGTVSLEQREWRVNSVVSYDFRHGRLKGWGLGGGVRWQSSVATGYPTFVGPAGIPVPDLKKPFLSGSEMNGDLWLSYKRRLFKDRVDWKIQLHLRNAIGSDNPIPVVTNPDGSLAIVRTPPGTQWFITNTLRF